MNLTALTPERQIFSGSVKSVKVPGAGGQFEILKDHAPIVAALSEGEVRIINSDGEKTVFNIESGFVEVLNNEVSLLIQAMKKD
jgi:F-type H+-transporting ATPase subunit epsilon